uniref:Uncharacterized protein n=1 Tax=Rhodopseudomonas palustris (strain ATCC BAA-98 / CGA009) TaxID=258594 RepID=Q6N3Z5_RHOPA|nr:hypothetical protein RPA3547 [Rhodopseudomonas palustris CGA009]
MHGLAALEERPAGGFVLLVQLEPAAVFGPVPFVARDLGQRHALADDFLEAKIFGGFLRRQPDQHAVAAIVEFVVVVLDHAVS